jgi:hypothetical protein
MPAAFALQALLLGLLAGLPAPAQAARPMVTDDARVVDPQSCQMESWVRREHGRTELWALPGCNATGNLELTVGGALRNEGSTHLSARVLQGKTLLRPLQTNDWGWGLVVGTVQELHAGNGREWYAYAPISRSLADDRLVLHLNLGWAREQGSSAGRASWGLGSETQLGTRSWLVAEAFGRGSETPQLQLGVRYWLVPERVQIDTTYGNRADGGQRWLSIGLRLLSPAWLR